MDEWGGEWRKSVAPDCRLQTVDGEPTVPGGYDGTADT